MDIKENYDRVLLVVFGIVALAVGILLSMKALALPDKFDRAVAKEDADYGATGLPGAQAAAAHLGKTVEWVSPSMEGIPQKKLPLTVSPPVWVQNGNEIDLLDPASPQIREGIENIYIHEHNLPAGRSDLATLDLDNDGFTTLQEFESGKTDPNDPASHPVFTDKLTVAEVKEDQYILEFRTSGGAAGEHGIRETTTFFEGTERAPIRKKTHFLRQGAAFGLHPGHENRYQIAGYEQKQKPGRVPGVLVDADELTIEDTTNPGNPFKLALRDPKVESTYYVVFHYSLPGHEGNLEGFFKLGELFGLPNDPDPKYKLVEIDVETGTAKIETPAADGETPKILNIPAMQKNG